MNQLFPWLKLNLTGRNYVCLNNNNSPFLSFLHSFACCLVSYQMRPTALAVRIFLQRVYTLNTRSKVVTKHSSSLFVGECWSVMMFVIDSLR